MQAFGLKPAPHQEPQNPEPAMGSKEPANPANPAPHEVEPQEKKKPDTDTKGSDTDPDMPSLVTPKKLNQINESGELISEDSSSSNSDDSNEDEEGEAEDEVENQALGIRTNYV